MSKFKVLKLLGRAQDYQDKNEELGKGLGANEQDYRGKNRAFLSKRI